MATASKKLQHPGTISYLHPTIIGVIASALLTLLVIVGSRNLSIFGYECKNGKLLHSAATDREKNDRKIKIALLTYYELGGSIGS